MSFDYSETVTERQLSRRTTRRRGARAEWENYLLESAVEFLHVKLANDPARRVAGDPSPWRRVVRHMVIKALRGLDTAPLEQLAAAIEVRWVQSRPVENELVRFAILAAARAHQGVPYRSEVLELLGADVAISREKNAWHKRLASNGFNWLPGGLPRKPKVRVAKIHARGFK